MTEGVILSLIWLTLLPQFRYAQQLPRRGSGFIFSVLRLSVNVIIHQICCGQEQASALPRRRLRRIVRNSLWLSLTHYATPPFPQKSRSARLFGCKRPHDGSLSLPTFADCGQGQSLSRWWYFNPCKDNKSKGWVLIRQFCFKTTSFCAIIR